MRLFAFAVVLLVSNTGSAAPRVVEVSSSLALSGPLVVTADGHLLSGWDGAALLEVAPDGGAQYWHPVPPPDDSGCLMNGLTLTAEGAVYAACRWGGVLAYDPPPLRGSTWPVLSQDGGGPLVETFGVLADLNGDLWIAD